MKIENTKTEDTATIEVDRLPPGEFTERVIAIANQAKSATWHGMSDEGVMPPDHMFMRGALALVQMTRARSPMNEAGLLASLLATSFTVVDNDSPVRAALLATVLDDPSAFLREAVMTNRRILGMPPQIELVPDGDDS